MIEKLNQLSTLIPEICQRLGQVYTIGLYEFEVSKGQFVASLDAIACTEQPALAWLADALKAAYIKSGWRYEIRYGVHSHSVTLWTGNTRFPFGATALTEAEALLDAILEALKDDFRIG